MSLKHGLLGLLNYAPMTGYELNKEFNGSLGYFWQAKASQIYRELDSMEQSGWLTSKRVVQDEKPNKRIYSITAQGKTEFLDWLSSLDPLKNLGRMKNAFLIRVFFGGELSREQTLELFRSFREIILEQSKQMQAVKDEINSLTPDAGYDSNKAVYWKLTALSGEIMYKANLEWVDKAIEILENIAEESETKNR
ncbi:MAG: PadR family transcriptional regulator [Oscillospiraceae bacterium]|nr:PadR family transcriptional regulator [Oscillospiraceae bacterium]